MGKRKIPPGAAWSPVLTLELATIAGPGAQGVGLLISGYADESVLEKWWPAVQGRINSSQVEDLNGQLLQAVHNALLYWTGMQSVLPIT